MAIEREGALKWDVAAHAFGISDVHGQQVSRQWVTARSVSDGVLELTDLSCGAISIVDLDRVESIYTERCQPGLRRVDIFGDELTGPALKPVTGQPSGGLHTSEV